MSDLSRQPGESRRLLTAQEAAAWLALPSPKWVLAQARADKIPHVRLGRYVRFDGEELSRWVRTDAARGPRVKGSA